MAQLAEASKFRLRLVEVPPIIQERNAPAPSLHLATVAQARLEHRPRAEIQIPPQLAVGHGARFRLQPIRIKNLSDPFTARKRIPQLQDQSLDVLPSEIHQQPLRQKQRRPTGGEIQPLHPVKIHDRRRQLPAAFAVIEQVSPDVHDLPQIQVHNLRADVHQPETTRIETTAQIHNHPPGLPSQKIPRVLIESPRPQGDINLGGVINLARRDALKQGVR